MRGGAVTHTTCIIRQSAAPCTRNYSWHVARTLDVAAMNWAAAFLVGQKDFATFGLPPQGDSTVREIFAAQWQVLNPYLVFHIEANAFLYRMVRSLVGSLVAVGTGSWSVDDFRTALQAEDREPFSGGCAAAGASFSLCYILRRINQDGCLDRRTWA